MYRPALIIVDMQNAFCSRNGSFLERGFSILNIDSVINKVQSLLSFAHREGILVIFTKLEYKPDYSDSGLLVKQLAPQIIDAKAYRRGSLDSEIFNFSERYKQDVTIVKKRYDPFVGTNLEDILKEHKITHMVVAGLLTNVCVESCVRSAFDRDFEVIIISDATSTYSQELYEASLTTMKRHFAKVTTLKDFVLYHAHLSSATGKASPRQYLNLSV